MRGTLVEPEYLASLDGIIPAHAGNTSACRHSALIAGDHPRACGEHGVTPVPVAMGPGSSPRMWGTRADWVKETQTLGIIPAHAGNTPAHRPSERGKWDHPRACGEHLYVFHVDFTGWGSSPRMRGTHVIALEMVMPAGIIPAHAGNTKAMT